MKEYQLGLIAGRSAGLFPTLDKGGIDKDRAEELTGEADENFLMGYRVGLHDVTGVWY